MAIKVVVLAMMVVVVVVVVIMVAVAMAINELTCILSTRKESKLSRL